MIGYTLTCCSHCPTLTRCTLQFGCSCCQGRTSVLSERQTTQKCWPRMSAKPDSILKYCRCWQMHHLTYCQKVALQQWFRLQMQVFLLSFGPRLLYFYTEELPSGTPLHLYGVWSVPSYLKAYSVLHYSQLIHFRKAIIHFFWELTTTLKKTTLNLQINIFISLFGP